MLPFCSQFNSIDAFNNEINVVEEIGEPEGGRLIEGYFSICPCDIDSLRVVALNYISNYEATRY